MPPWSKQRHIPFALCRTRRGFVRGSFKSPDASSKLWDALDMFGMQRRGVKNAASVWWGASIRPIVWQRGASGWCKSLWSKMNLGPGERTDESDVHQAALSLREIVPWLVTHWTGSVGQLLSTARFWFKTRILCPLSWTDRLSRGAQSTKRLLL